MFSIPVTGGTPTNLFSFDGTHGASPYGDLTLSGSTLYGMTFLGGANSAGTAFGLPVGGGTPTVLYSFDANDGDSPYGSLTPSGSTLYGMTSSGGANGEGTIFAVTDHPGDANGDGKVDINDLTVVPVQLWPDRVCLVAGLYGRRLHRQGRHQRLDHRPIQLWRDLLSGHQGRPRTVDHRATGHRRHRAAGVHLATACLSLSGESSDSNTQTSTPPYGEKPRRYCLPFAFSLTAARDQLLEGRFIKLVAFAQIDGAPGVPAEAGIEHASRVFDERAARERELHDGLVGLPSADDPVVRARPALPSTSTLP